MKILHVYKSYYPECIGGIEKTIYQLAAQCTDGYKHKATVLCLAKKPQRKPFEMDGHTIIQAKQDIFLFSTGLSLEFFSKFRELIKNADIIHYHFPWPWMDLACLLYGRKKISICTYHSDIIRQRYLLKLYQPIMNLFLSSMNAIIATSANYLCTSKVLQKHLEKIRVIPIGIPDLYYEGNDLYHTEWRRKLPEKYFVFIGVLRYYKGLHILIEALAGWDVPTIIVGAGPVETSLKKQAVACGLKNIIFLGAVSEVDKNAIIDLSYAMVFPSHLRSEAFGISLLEGARAGKPLISSEIGTGTSFININGETGIVVKPSSPEDLATAMKKLYCDEEMARNYGKNARARFLKYFTVENMCSSYNELYCSLHSE